MLRRLTRLLLTLVFINPFALPVVSQTVSFSSAFSSGTSAEYFSILGNSQKHIFVLSVSQNNPPKLLLYNHQLEPAGEMELPDLKNSRLLLAIPRTDELTLLYEKPGTGYRSYKVLHTADEPGNEKEILQLPLQRGSRWELIASPAYKNFLLYSVDAFSADSTRVNTFIINSEFEISDGKQFSFNLDRNFDQLDYLFIDDLANVYILVHDQPDNYRLGSRLRFFKYASATEILTRKETYFKEKKPVDIHLGFSADGRQIFLHSLYYDFYTKNVNGVLTSLLDSNLNELKPVYYFSFDKQFKKQLNNTTSGVSSAMLVDNLKIYRTTIRPDGVSFVSSIIETDLLLNQTSNSAANNTTKNFQPADMDPILGMIQREALIRNQMRLGRTGGRSGSTIASAGNTVSYAEAYMNVMGQRPDLFFMGKDSTLNANSNRNFLKKKIYDRLVLFGFHSSGEMAWHRWYETEDQSLFKRQALIPAETETDYVSVYYRHNFKDKAELAFTRVSKKDGSLHDVLLSVPAHISLLTTKPLCAIGANRVVLLYVDNRTKQAGLAKLEW